MANTTLGVKVDDLLRARLKDAALRIERTPHWLIKQAIFAYLEKIERGQMPPELSAAQVSAEVAELSDIPLIVPSDHYGVVEDVHLIINHILVDYFKTRLAETRPCVL